MERSRWAFDFWTSRGRPDVRFECEPTNANDGQRLLLVWSLDSRSDEVAIKEVFEVLRRGGAVTFTAATMMDGGWCALLGACASHVHLRLLMNVPELFKAFSSVFAWECTLHGKSSITVLYFWLQLRSVSPCKPTVVAPITAEECDAIGEHLVDLTDDAALVTVHKGHPALGMGTVTHTALDLAIIMNMRRTVRAIARRSATARLIANHLIHNASPVCRDILLYETHYPYTISEELYETMNALHTEHVPSVVCYLIGDYIRAPFVVSQS